MYFRRFLMYCSECGKELPDDALICTNCGVPTESYSNEEQKIRNESVSNTQTNYVNTYNAYNSVQKISLYVFIGCLIAALFCTFISVSYYSAYKESVKESANSLTDGYGNVDWGNVYSNSYQNSYQSSMSNYRIYKTFKYLAVFLYVICTVCLIIYFYNKKNEVYLN